MIDDVYYADEVALKQHLRDLIEDDFEIEEEIEGHFLPDGSLVRIDFLIRPKAHQIERGFGDLLLGVEVKPLTRMATHLMKRRALRAAWQAITYRFAVYEGRVLDGVLLFPGLDVFEAQEDFPASLEAVTALLKLANVGYIRQIGDTWEVRFGARRHFHGELGAGYFAGAGLKYTVGHCERRRLRLKE